MEQRKTGGDTVDRACNGAIFNVVTVGTSSCKSNFITFHLWFSHRVRGNAFTDAAFCVRIDDGRIKEASVVISRVVWNRGHSSSVVIGTDNNLWTGSKCNGGGICRDRDSKYPQAGANNAIVIIDVRVNVIRHGIKKSGTIS